MVSILFETTAATFDDENELISGWTNAHLSPTGMEQAKKIGERHTAETQPDAIFHADLKASDQTSNIAFIVNPQLIFTDWRLRECNYGDFNKAHINELQPIKSRYITSPFPNGESYNQFLTRLYNCLTEMKVNWDTKAVLIIGGPDIKCGLDYLLKSIPMEQSLNQPLEWEPGWLYDLP